MRSLLDDLEGVPERLKQTAHLYMQDVGRNLHGR